MTSSNYSNFTGLMGFISEVFVREKSQEAELAEKQWQKNEEAKNRHLLSELKERGLEDTLKHIENQIRRFESEFPLQKSKASVFEVSLKKANLTLLKGAEAHFVFSIVDFIKRDVFDSTGRVEVSYSIKKLNISHLKSEDPSSTEMLRRISEKTSKDKMLYINQVYYYVDGSHRQNRWEVKKNYEVFLAPVIIRLSPEVYAFITEFFFSSPNSPKDSADPRDARKADDLHQKVAAADQMLEHPDRFYRMNKMTLKAHKEILRRDAAEEDVLGKGVQVPQTAPTYYKKIKIHKMNIYLTIKTDSVFTVDCRRA